MQKSVPGGFPLAPGGKEKVKKWKHANRKSENSMEEFQPGAFLLRKMGRSGNEKPVFTK